MNNAFGTIFWFRPYHSQFSLFLPHCGNILTLNGRNKEITFLGSVFGKTPLAHSFHCLPHY